MPAELSEEKMGSSILPWLSKDNLEDELEGITGRPFIRFVEKPAEYCRGRPSSGGGRGVISSGSAIETAGFGQ